VISSIAVKNFQSLYDVEVPLTEFTAIVGPSSTGKSAFVRAVRLLLQNARGTGFISHGEDETSVTASFSDDQHVRIRRGKRNQYELWDASGQVETFTKLGGEVPEVVQRFLGLDPAVSVAAQFDPPFLLSSSGTEVARMLGSLTNVEVVFGAGREANRRKLAATATARALQGPLEEDRAALTRFSTLDERVAAVEAAEDALAALEEAEAPLTRLISLQETLQEQIAALQQITSVSLPENLEELFLAAEEAVAAEFAAERFLFEIDQDNHRVEMAEQFFEMPSLDLDGAEAAQQALEQAEELFRRFTTSARAYKQAQREMDVLDVELEDLREDYQQALEDAGECPTCGQGITPHADHALPA
jgi:tetratricopeptide (TPR) repeat protein